MKCFSNLIITLSILHFGHTFDITKEEIIASFRKNEIAPCLIDTSPEEPMNVEYNEGSEWVNFGNELLPTQTKKQPVVMWNADPNKYYVLAMIDPDAPNRTGHSLREVNHWLVANIPGEDLQDGDLLATYIGPGPPKRSGLHRYIFLIFEQPGKLIFKERKITATSPINHRFKFSIRTFASTYKLGQPVFGNFYQAQWDSSVDTSKKSGDKTD